MQATADLEEAAGSTADLEDAAPARITLDQASQIDEDFDSIIYTGTSPDKDAVSLCVEARGVGSTTRAASRLAAVSL